MTFWVLIFAASFFGLTLMIVFKVRALRAEKVLMFGYLDELADRNLREGLNLLLKGKNRLNSIFNRENAKYLAQILLAIIIKLYVISKTGFRKYFSRFFDAVAGKKLLNKKGSVSFFLKDILDYKNSLTKKQD
jgi:hypothetical protein